MSEEQNILNTNSEFEDTGKALDDLNKKINSNDPKARPTTSYGNRPYNNRKEGQSGGFRGKKKSFFAKKVCKFTTNQIDPATIDYKNVELLKRFIMPSGKIVPRRITGTCSKYQRVLAREIKKARIMAFIPFSAR